MAFGSTCPSRSIAAPGPMSVAQEDHVAPRLDAASMQTTVSIRFGMYPTTRSPAPTPDSRNERLNRATESYNSA